MTGYEIIKGNVKFTGPDRIGLRFDRIAGKGDVCRIFVLPPKSTWPEGAHYTVCLLYTSMISQVIREIFI